MDLILCNKCVCVYPESLKYCFYFISGADPGVCSGQGTGAVHIAGDILGSS